MIMYKIPEHYIEKLYSGWLGKVIGVIYGAPIEGWSYEQIAKIYGELDGYLVHYKDFAADDDLNGPVFFIRALEDYTHTRDITTEQMGLAWLNYAPYEHGFYWWGGYGKSTEHTAYMNLRSGIMAPRSGSVEQNGAEVAEQIGGQIFIDAWGLVAPGNPMLAASYAEKAASVSHGGNGIYGGMFVAACISAAFVEKDIGDVIQAALAAIPQDCDYAKTTRAVMDFHRGCPDDWRACFQYIRQNFWTDQYPGFCHIIPNAAIMVLSMLYGGNDFSRTISICNMCGFDTDCNVGNVGTIMGVLCGLAGIDRKKWIRPVNDFMVCSSVIGSLNIVDIPGYVSYLANLGYKIAGEQAPGLWADILSEKAPRFHFEYPGSTHGFRVKSEHEGVLEYDMHHTIEAAHTGKGALKVVAKSPERVKDLKIFHKTYYRPKDLHDSRYDPSFSPILYPGQTVKASVMLPEYIGNDAMACLYVKDGNSGREYDGEWADLTKGQWIGLVLDIPRLEGACLEEAGVKITLKNGWYATLAVLIDDMDFSGMPDYSIDFAKERMEVWHMGHKEVSQFTHLKGIWSIENGEMSGTSHDFGEAYTGGYNWKDYRFAATLIPQLGTHHNINFRVQGAIRSYAAGLAPEGRLVLYKNDNGYKELASVPFSWQAGKEYRLQVEVHRNQIAVMAGGERLIEYTDTDRPYLKGLIGASILHGSHCHYKDMEVCSLK